MSNLVIANFNTGFETDKAPFLINNDAFPEINNAYIWRDRVKKKRGVSLLGRLQRMLTNQVLGVSDGAGSFTGNILSILSLEANSSLVVSSITVYGSGNITAVTQANPAQVTSANHNLTTGNMVTISGVVGMTQLNGNTYTITVVDANNFTLGIDSTGFTAYVSGGIWQSSNGVVITSINYATGAISITSPFITKTLLITVSYTPNLPVMGIRQFNQNFTGASTPDNVNFPLYVFFDTKYSYLFKGTTGPFYDVNYFFGSGVHFLWSGQDYQQFWTANYQGAMFATNNVPGLNFLNGTYVSGTGTNNITFNFKSNGVNFTTLVIGDTLYFNEWNSGGSTLNTLTGTVSNIAGAAAGNYVVTFTTTPTASGTGIVQMITNTIPGQDGIKYFIGDPIGSPPSPTLTKGWVNFSPPLSNAAAPSYLVGAKIIIPFKNRLLFFATWTQTSTGAAIYNPNQLVACQNGTVFYANTGLPPNQTADPTSFYQNVVGKGLRLNAPISQEIIVVNPNNDVVIVIFENQPLKLYSTGDDSAPFLYQTVSTEFGAQSTFSAVPLDSGVLSIGPYGFALTDQNSARRFDLPIPDQVFNIRQDDHGINRVCSIRDWRNEFVYFTFPTNANSASNSAQNAWKFPTTTLAFNYRDNLWSTFTENYTAYGNFKYSTGYTWATLPFRTWSVWHNPWNFGATQTKYPFVACGNQQGFIMLKQEDTFEDQSQYIKAITITGSGLSLIVTITSPSHNLNDGDYILIQNALGMTNLNGVIFSISVTESLPDTFTLFLTVAQQTVTPPSGTYLGGGTYSRLTNINILTKQFPLGWQDGRQTRLGTQRYLLTTTTVGQLSANLYVSQNNNLPANSTEYSPYLPFSNVLLTCFEGNDLNLTQGDQDQIWHRINTPVIGDTVQVGLTLSDAQMRDPGSNDEEIELYAIVLSVAPGPVLAF
jgi:hypothetical protein